MTTKKLAAWLSTAIAVFCLALAVPQARANELDDIIKAKKIRIGVQNDVPPYSQTDENHQPVGYDIDVAKLLAKDMGVELEMVAKLLFHFFVHLIWKEKRA